MNGLRARALILALLPAAATAEGVSYSCSYEGLERRVEIVTEPGVSVPCEVHYYKDTEAPGEREVLWRARNDAEFCERKTAEFVGQLLAWGWTCGVSEPAPSEPDAADEPALPVDDDAVDTPDRVEHGTDER